MYHEDPWRILGIRRGAGSEEIRIAYRKLVKLHHPDAGGDPARFQQVTTAYAQLTASRNFSHLSSPEPNQGTKQHRVAVVYGVPSYGPLYRSLRRCLKPRLIWRRGRLLVSTPLILAFVVPVLGLKINPLLTLACGTVILCTGRLRIARY